MPCFCIFAIPGTIIVHEAWDEPDSLNLDAADDRETLHGQGLEAKISVSEVIEGLPFLDRKDYVTDTSEVDNLAMLAACVGFDYVKINTDSTISVAVGQCYNSETKYDL